MRTSNYRKKLHIDKKVWKIIGAGAGGLLLAGVIFFFTYYRVEHVEVMGSSHYSETEVREMILRQKEKYGWEFLFLGANIDAVETAGHLGIDPDRAANYHSDSQGTKLNYEAVSCAVSAVRASAPLSAAWKRNIERDYKKRKR